MIPEPQIADLAKEIAKQVSAHPGIDPLTFWLNLGVGAALVYALYLIWKQLALMERGRAECQKLNHQMFQLKSDSQCDSRDQWAAINEAKADLAETRDRVSHLEGVIESDSR